MRLKPEIVIHAISFVLLDVQGFPPLLEQVTVIIFNRDSDGFARQQKSLNTRRAIVVLTTFKSVTSLALFICIANPVSLQNDLELLRILAKSKF